MATMPWEKVPPKRLLDRRPGAVINISEQDRADKDGMRIRTAGERDRQVHIVCKVRTSTKITIFIPKVIVEAPFEDRLDGIGLCT